MGFIEFRVLLRLILRSIHLSTKIRFQLDSIERKLERMSDDQAKLDTDVAALTDAASQIEAEIEALKNQPAAAGLDFTNLDAVVDRLTADEPAPAPAPDPVEPVDPNQPTA